MIFWNILSKTRYNINILPSDLVLVVEAFLSLFNACACPPLTVNVKRCK